MSLAKQRDLVDGMMKMHDAMDIGGAHQKRIDQRFPRGRKTGLQIVRAELVHQKADGAAMHAVDRLARTHVLVQRLQHQSVATERHHDIGLSGIVIAVESDQLSKRLLGLRAGTRDEGDPVISLGRSHGSRAHYLARGQDRVRRGRLYDLGYPCRDSSPSRECHWTGRGTTLQSEDVDLLANNARPVAVLS